MIKSLVKLGALSLGLYVASAWEVQAINLNFDYSLDTNNFFSPQERRDRLEEAASFFEFFTDNLEAINPSGSNNWTAIFSNPATGAQERLRNLTVAENTLIIYAGGRSLLGSTLGIGGPGGFSASGSASFVNTVRTRGQVGATGDSSTATDFGPWGGSITFNTSANWNFSSDNPGGGQNDFLSVAIHELSHALGFGTSKSWEHFVSSGNFTGPESVASFGGNITLDTNEAHWQEGTQSTVNRLGLPDGVVQETAMDPSLFVGTRKLLTELDYAGLNDVGWEAKTSTPEPGLLFGLISFGFFGFIRQRKR